MTDKLELKSCHEVVYTVDVDDVDSIFQGKSIDPDILTVVMKDGKRRYCDEVCPVDSLQEEPVSEDLEKQAHKELEDVLEVTCDTQCAQIAYDEFKAGAQWQEKQDQSTIELAEDHAMLAGMEKTKEQMMAKAIDAELYSDGMLTPIIKVNDKEKISDIKFGDKIKLIIIKEDKDE